MRITTRVLGVPAAALLSMATLAPLSATPVYASGATWTTIATGLDNPRDLAFGPGGRLYVAEAGRGGPDCVSGGEEGEMCVGLTSGISQLGANGTHHRVVSGLISVAGSDGTGATGVDGISVLGNGGIFGIITGAPQFVSDDMFTAADRAAARAQLGQLVKANLGGQWKATAPVGKVDFDWANDHQSLEPDQFPDANPYGVLATPSGSWVVDAGANTLDWVARNGSVTVKAFFPNPPSSDAVPTCIDKGPDGALYVGELTGGGNAPGSSIVWRVVPGQDPQAWATGLTAVTGCGFGADGSFYAVEFSTQGFESFQPFTGALVRVTGAGATPQTVVDGLSFPGGFAAGRDGSIYLSNWSIMPGDTGGGPTGSVVKVTGA